MVFFQAINPYDVSIGVNHAIGLAAVKTAIGGGMNFDQLNSATVTSVGGIYYAAGMDPFTTDEMKTILPVAVNSFMNPSLKGYNGGQMKYVDLMLNSIISDVPVGSIPDFFKSLENDIAQCGMSIEEQAPLFMALATGKADYAYWMGQIGAGGGWMNHGTWSAIDYVNHANIPFIVQSSVYGSLCVANQAKNYGLLDPPRITGVDLVAAQVAGIGVVAAKVLFGWIPNTGDCSCNR